jgi:hypothetical protein
MGPIEFLLRDPAPPSRSLRREMGSGGIEIAWFVGRSSSPIATVSAGEIRIRDRKIIVARWEGGEEVFVGHEELFGQWGPERALVIRSARQPNAAMLVGQEGSELLKLDLERPAVSRVAELPRVNLEPDAGYHRLKAHLRGEMILLNWELGILALDPSFELRWRQDLVWNHRIVHLDDGEIWFDYFYDSEDGSQQIGVEPYGFSVATGQQLFDRRPPDGATEPA